MKQALQALLPRHSPRLVSFESVEPTPLLTKPTAEENQLYRHGLKLVLLGSYHDIRRYFAMIERLPWRFVWGEMHYRVKDYPQAEVELILYSVSPKQEFIGV